MATSCRAAFTLLATVAAALATAAPADAQAAPPGLVVGVRNFTHIVASLERSLQFYRDVIGLEVDGPPRVFGGDLAMKVVNVTTPGAQSLFASLRVSGSPLGVEIVEYQGVDRRAVQPRVQDPGAAVITLTVRDLDGIVARAQRAGIRISTTGGSTGTAPAAARGGRMVILQDPDGFFVALAQPSAVPETLAPASSNIVASSFDVMVADTGRTSRLYEQGLGFQIRSGDTSGTAAALMDLTGPGRAQVTSSSAQIPGTAMTIGFHEFSGIDRTPLRTRFQDPGTAVLQLLARDVKAVAAAWKKAGGEVVTGGGEPVTMGALTLVVLRDPNNLMLEVISAP